MMNFPQNELRIDKTFIQGIGDNYNDKTIITLADSLGLEVVAEGVEDHRQLAFLSEYDCHVIQGFYDSKPLLAKDIESMFLQRQ